MTRRAGRWDLDRIHAKGYTDNVVDLMVGKLTRLPVETQQALQQLACLGNVAEIAMLSIVLADVGGAGPRGLWPAVRRSWSSGWRVLYRFSHDRVQEAAYSLIPAECAAEAHLRIGTPAGGADAAREAGGGDLRDRQSAQPRRRSDHRNRMNGTNLPTGSASSTRAFLIGDYAAASAAASRAKQLLWNFADLSSTRSRILLLRGADTRGVLRPERR